MNVVEEKHRPNCLAIGESEVDEAIRLVNIGPCECECAAQPEEE